jgi:hypothetical protein
MLGAEIRNAIQNWRKENKLPIDFRIPTLYVYYKDEIIKTVLIEGITDTFTKQHLFELCLVDNVEFVRPRDEIGFSKAQEDRWKDFLDFDKHDLIFWSPLGGSIGVCDCLKGNTPNIQKELDIVIDNHYYNTYV